MNVVPQAFSHFPRHLKRSGLCGIVPMRRQPDDGPLPRCFTCAVGNDATQCAALRDLYFATNGPSSSQPQSGWSNNRGWSSAAAGFETDYCQFYGVTCTGNNVTRMYDSSKLLTIGFEGADEALRFQRLGKEWLPERLHSHHAQQPHELDLFVRAA